MDMVDSSEMWVSVSFFFWCLSKGIESFLCKQLKLTLLCCFELKIQVQILWLLLCFN